MAELYSQPKGSLFADTKSGGVAYTGDAEVDSYLNELPEEERKKELDRYNAPLSGEEVAQALMQSTTYTPTVKEYKAYKEYQATKSTDIFDGISMAAGAVVDDLARGFQGAGKDPSKIPASVVEAFAQGTRNLYGMVAQSQDPDSVLFKWKDALSNSYSDEGYRQFLEARDFNRHSVDLMEGKTTLLVQKDLVNNDIVQAASYIADPTLFIPFGGVAGKAASLIGMGERLAAVTARASIIKNMVYAGALKYGAGVPLEFIGGATRRVIDKGIEAGSSVFETATGISAKDAANYVKTAGFGTSVSGIAGYPVPYASAVSNAYLKANIASGLGESLTAVADQMLKNQGRRGYMSFAEAAIRESDAMLAKGGQGLSPHARKLLNVIDKADPMFAYAMEGLEGAAMGSAIGGGLGYLSAGEEGLAGGIGSGAVLGGVGGVAGRVVSDVAGASLKAERKVQADLALELMKEADPAKFTELSRLRAIAEANGDNIDGYIAGIDLVSPSSRWTSGDINTHEAYLQARGQDPKTFDGFERNADGSYKLDDKGNQVRLLDEQGFEVPTVKQFDGGAGWTMTRNADGAVKVHINTTRYNPNTVPHELFHAIFREEAMKPEFKNRLARAILGTFDENGKMVAQPTISQAESKAFFESYIKAENKGNAGTIADNLSLLDKALTEYYKDGTMSVMSEDGKTPYLTKLTEEFGAYYFTQFIQGKRPDFLFRGGQYSGMRGLIETVKTGWLDYMERKITSVNPTFDFNRPDQTINPAFKDASGKRIRVSALDHLMTDIVKATSQTNRNGSFDFRTLSPEGQEAYVKANGLSRIYRKRANGKYERMNKPEQAAYDKARGVEIFKAINGLPPDALRATDANGVVTHELIPVRDAKGNILHYEGTMSPAVLDHLQRTGYLDAPEKLRIQQLQDIVAGRTKSNIIEFIYFGKEEGIAEGADIRVSGDAVSVKSRVALVLAMNNKIKANGEHSFTALTLDWRNIKMRGEKLWADPAVRKMWNDDQSAFQGDFFRYLENASLPEGKRVPSAQLWQVDGEKKRNIMHQFAGMQRTGVVDGKGGSYFNAPNAEIVNDVTASITNFRTEGMGNITLTNDIVKFNPEGIKPIQMNFMPSEMSSEKTPNGLVRTSKDGYKFIEDTTGVKVYKPNGDLIGKYSTAEEAQAKALQSFQKDNPNGKPIASVDNIRNEPADAPETLEQYVTRKEQTSLSNLDNISSLINSKDFVDTNFGESIWLQERLKKARVAENYNLENPRDIPFNDAINYFLESNIHTKGMSIKEFLNDYFKKQYFREQEANNPTFVSGLSVALDKILPANVNKEGTIQASRLINLMKSASGGDIGKILTEANSIGFTEYLKSKGQQRISVSEIKDFIDKNGIRVSIDPRTDIRGNEWNGGGFDTSRYVAEGKKDGYYTFVVRINPEQAHGVEGHFGGDTIAHIRATIRTDAQGRKVLFIEEIQSINTNAGVLTPEARIKTEAELKELKPLQEKYNEIRKEFWDNEQDIINNNNLTRAKARGVPETEARKILDDALDKNKKIYWKNLDDFDLQHRATIEKYTNYGQYEVLTGYFTRLISERESKLAKKKNDKPLQDFNETVKIASRTIMRKAVELGADRVVLVRPEDMHPDVSKNAEGERFVDAAYGKDIPMMMDAELKKYGQRLAPARNYPSITSIESEYRKNLNINDGKYGERTETWRLLSDSLGYDITPEMKQKAGRSQTFMMPSENSDIIYTGRRFVGQVKGGMWATKDFKRLENAGGIKAYRVSPDARVLVLHKTKFDKKGNYLYSDINKSGFSELRKIALESGQDLDFWDSKEQLFSNPEQLDGDSLFPSLDTNETMRMSDNEIADRNTEFPEQETRNSINKRDLLQAVKDAGYDIIKTTTIEGEATLILNENAITPLTIDDKLPIHYMPSEGGQVAYKGKPLDVKEPNASELRNAGQGTFTGGYYTERKTVKLSDIAPVTKINLSLEEQRRISKIVNSIKSGKGYIERLIIDADGNIIEGGHRYLALKELGITDIPVVQLTEKARLLKNYNNILSEYSKVSELRPEQTRQMVEQAIDIINKEGISALDEFEMPKQFQQSWNKLKDIIKSKESSAGTKNMMPAEGEYRSGDNYWKAKENKFEGVDADGRTYRLAYVVGKNGVVEHNPEFVSWFDIGHSSGNAKDVKRFGLWGENKTNWWNNKENPTEIITKPLGNNFYGNHEEWFQKQFKYSEEEPTTKGRYELPVYDSKGKLVTRGKLSINDSDLDRNMGSFKNLKEKICKKLKIKSEDVDAYIFGGRTKVNEELGIPHKDQLPIKFMPAEQAEAWRKFESESISDGNSIFKNAMNYVIIQANNKFKVYNPQKALLGIYNDLDGAKRRVQREEPKPR
jgi:hypothetical protein